MKVLDAGSPMKTVGATRPDIGLSLFLSAKSCNRLSEILWLVFKNGIVAQCGIEALPEPYGTGRTTA